MPGEMNPPAYPDDLKQHIEDNQMVPRPDFEEDPRNDFEEPDSGIAIIDNDPEARKGTNLRLVHDTELLIATYLPPSDAPPPSKELPQVPTATQAFCLPQLSVGFDTPFARGYNTELDASAGLRQEDVLKFVDGLNMAMTASPPLRVVGLAGQVIGFVPHHWAKFAALGITTVANAGVRTLAKGLTDRYLRAANERLFHPRDLSVRICTTPAMMAILTHSHPTAKTAGQKAKAALDVAGRLTGKFFLWAPIPFSSRIVRAIASPAPRIAPSDPHSGPSSGPTPIVFRRLELVKDLALPVSFDGIPPPSTPANVMERMNAWSVKMTAFKQRRHQGSVERKRRLLAAAQAGDYEGYMQIYEAAQGPRATGDGIAATVSNAWGDLKKSREESKMRRQIIKQTKRDQWLWSFALGPKETALERKVKNADLFEMWTTNNRILWIVIMPKEQDEGIKDITMADDQADEETMSEETWLQELRDEEEDEEAQEEVEKETLAEATAATNGKSAA